MSTLRRFLLWSSWLAPVPAVAQIPLHQWTGKPGERIGFHVRGAGDVDGDGREDLILGVTRVSPLDPAWSTPVRVVSGATGALLLAVQDPLIAVGFGRTVGPLDDIDGDGHADFVIGTLEADFGLGAVGAVGAHSGFDGSLLWQSAGNVPDVLFGTVLARTGDLDGDLVRDLAVSAIDYSAPTTSGYVRALSGATGAVLWSASPAQPGFGASLAALGDVDGDGIDDLAVGAPEWNGAMHIGKVHILSGADGATLQVIDEGPSIGLGGGVSGLGDVDGDGRADLAAVHDAPPARVRLYSALTGTLIRELPPPAAGVHRMHVTGAGDDDGDGVPDLFVSTPGGAVVQSGADGAILRRFFLHVPFETTTSIDVVEDMDGDGRRDFALGGIGIEHTTGAVSGSGEVIAFSGAFSTDVRRSCFGDAASGPPGCPCEQGSVGAGCHAGAIPSLRGARLFAEGSTSVSADDLRIVMHSPIQGEPALLLAGSTHTTPTPFESGLLCAGGELVRLALIDDPEHLAVFGPGLGLVRGWTAGERRTFQVLYRSPDPVCWSDFGLSNAVDVHFGP